MFQFSDKFIDYSKMIKEELLKKIRVEGIHVLKR